MYKNNSKKNMFDDSSEEMIKQIKKLSVVENFDWAKASQHQDGVVINAELTLPLNSSKNQKPPYVDTITVKNSNAIAFSTHVSGGRTCFLDQNIATLGGCSTKPNLFVVDSNRDLYIRHAKTLEQNGYHVRILDFNDIAGSDRWNPFSQLIWRIKLIRELENELENRDGKYYGIGEMFTTYKDVRSRIQELRGDLYKEICGIVGSIYNTDTKSEAKSVEGAKKLLSAFVLAICEDCIASRLCTSQLVLMNLFQNFDMYCKGDAKQLREYLVNKRHRHSTAKKIVMELFKDASDNTIEDIFFVAGKMMNLDCNYNLCVLTSEDTIDLYKEDDEQKAVFIVMPPKGNFMHGYVELILRQAYSCKTEIKDAVSRQIGYREPNFVRPNYYLVNGYDILPRLDFSNSVFGSENSEHRIILVGRSYAQLLNEYGDDFAKWVKQQCGVKLFLSVDDTESREEYIKLCCSADNGESQDSYLQSFKEVELFDKVRGIGNSVVSVMMNPPFITRFTSSETLLNLYCPLGFYEGRAGEGMGVDKRISFDVAKDEFLSNGANQND